MGDWRSVLKEDPTDWLLEVENPSVRYFALLDILELPETDPAVVCERAAVMNAGTVPELLSRQQAPEYLDNFGNFYTAKYSGLVWSLIILAELGAARDRQIAEQCEYLMTNSQELSDGGFAMHTATKTGGGRRTEVIPCLTGNLVWCLLRFGLPGRLAL